MEFTLADLSRRLENMIRFGTIAEVQHTRKPKVRVRIGTLLTAWIPVSTVQAGRTRTWVPPAVGEQCIVLSPSGNPSAGVAVPGINSSSHPAPDDNPDGTRTEFEDGAVIDYNSKTHHYQITLPTDGKFTIQVGASTLELSNAGTVLTTPHFSGVQS